MQKTHITIAVSTLSLLALGISAYFSFFQKAPIWEITTTTTPDAISVTYEEQQTSVERQNMKNSELYNTAMQDQDAAICTGISDSRQQSECSDMIIASIAKKAGTIEICDTITSTGTMILCRDVISSDRAITQADRQLCDTLSDMDLRTTCQESIDEIQLTAKTRDNTITREFCDTLGARSQSICLTQIREIDETALYRDALGKNDAKLCEQILQTELRNTCLDTIRLKSAVTSENTTLCDTITDPDKKLYCESQVSKTADIALYKSAITGTDPSACIPIINSNLENKCHDTIIIASIKRNNDTTLCTGLTATGMISACQAIWQ
jgi:ethanolamine utilization microcompartment shell protein EutS